MSSKQVKTTTVVQWKPSLQWSGAPRVNASGLGKTLRLKNPLRLRVPECNIKSTAASCWLSLPTVTTLYPPTKHQSFHNIK